MAHQSDQPRRPDKGKSLDRPASQMSPGDPYLNTAVRDSTLSAAERQIAARDTTTEAVDEWNDANADRVQAVRDAEAAHAAEAAADRAPSPMTNPVDAVKALHRLISAANLNDDERGRMLSAVTVLADPKAKPVTKADTRSRLTATFEQKIQQRVQALITKRQTEYQTALAPELAQLRTEIARLRASAPAASGAPLQRIVGGAGARSRRQEADSYIAKAEATTDPTLRQGYLNLAANLNRTDN